MRRDRDTCQPSTRGPRKLFFLGPIDGAVHDQPVLEGSRVRLEPLRPEHVGRLWAAAADPDTWRYMTFDVRSPEDLARWVEARRAPMATGRAMPFCQIDRATEQAVGSTSLFDIDPHNRRLEIGHTWLAERARRTGINREAKSLLLRYAFETLGMERVQLKTDARNERAQRAIEALGAAREGVLRRHDVLPDGHVRDAVVYSILRHEWPAVVTRLSARDLPTTQAVVSEHAPTDGTAAHHR